MDFLNIFLACIESELMRLTESYEGAIDDYDYDAPYTGIFPPGYWDFLDTFPINCYRPLTLEEEDAIPF